MHIKCVCVWLTTVLQFVELLVLHSATFAWLDRALCSTDHVRRDLTMEVPGFSLRYKSFSFDHHSLWMQELFSAQMLFAYAIYGQMAMFIDMILLVNNKQSVSSLNCDWYQPKWEDLSGRAPANFHFLQISGEKMRAEVQKIFILVMFACKCEKLSMIAWWVKHLDKEKLWWRGETLDLGVRSKTHRIDKCYHKHCWC